MFELLLALFMASPCPSHKPLNIDLSLNQRVVAVDDTVGDHTHFPPGPTILKHPVTLGVLLAVDDTIGDHTHFPPGPTIGKRLPISRIVAFAGDTPWMFTARL